MTHPYEAGFVYEAAASGNPPMPPIACAYPLDVDVSSIGATPFPSHSPDWQTNSFVLLGEQPPGGSGPIYTAARPTILSGGDFTIGPLEDDENVGVVFRFPGLYDAFPYDGSQNGYKVDCQLVDIVGGGQIQIIFWAWEAGGFSFHVKTPGGVEHNLQTDLGYTELTADVDFILGLYVNKLTGQVGLILNGTDLGYLMDDGGTVPLIAPEGGYSGLINGIDNSQVDETFVGDTVSIEVISSGAVFDSQPWPAQTVDVCGNPV